MTQQHAGYRVLAFVIIVAVLHRVGHLSEVRARESVPLRIELIVVRGLGPRQADMVRHEVDAIWSAQGVTIEWSADATRPSVRVLIDRPASVLPKSEDTERWPVAATRTVDGRVTPPVYVSLDAAERVVRAASPPASAPALGGIMVPRVVGRAIAHELAHFLLNTRVHTVRGLLQARFTPDDFVSPATDAFNLEPWQIAAVRQHQILALRQ